MRRLCVMGNAASIHTLRWASYFSHAGWKVCLITWRRPRQDYDLPLGVQVRRIHFPPHYVFRWLALLEVAVQLRRFRPHLIHAHYAGTFGILGGLYCKLAGFHPLVVSAWGAHGLLHARGVRRALTELAFSVADRVHIDGPNMLEVLAGYGVSSDKTVLVHFGTDISVFNQDAHDQDLRRSFGRDGRCIVVSTRTLEPIYDVATLLRAAVRVLVEQPNTMFVIAGDGSERKDLESLAVSLGIRESVCFAGRLSPSDIATYLASSDVYVSTSLSDAGLAASTAEAMGCGLPVVVTDFGDNGNWVRDGETGYLFPCGDEQSLAECLALLLRDPELRKRLGRNARGEIVERNNCEVEMGKMERIYLELIERYRQ